MAAPHAIFETIEVRDLNVGDIFKLGNNIFLLKKKTPHTNTTFHVVLETQKLNQIDKVFEPKQTDTVENIIRVDKINCPPAAQPAAGTTSGGSRSRKRSTSRNSRSRKLRKAN